MRNRRRIFSYAIGLLVSAGVFAVINYRHFHRPAACADCFFPYGLPFTIYHEGGFGGGAGYVWAGLAGDAALMLGLGLAIGWFFERFLSRTRIII